MRYRAILLLSSLFLLMGCKEDFPVYTSFCEQNTTKFPDCLRYAVLNDEDKKMIVKTFGIKDDTSCPYRVELTRYHIGLCDNPVIKSRGSDFDGYVRLEIKKSFECYYKVQSDFKNDENAAFERVLKRVRIDLDQ